MWQTGRAGRPATDAGGVNRGGELAVVTSLLVCDRLIAGAEVGVHGPPCSWVEQACRTGLKRQQLPEKWVVDRGTNALMELRTWAQLRAKDSMWSRAMSSATAIGSEL